MPLNNPCTTDEIKEDIKKYLETMENGKKVIQNIWKAARAVLKRKCIVTRQPQEARKISKKKKKKRKEKENLTLFLKKIGKEE